MVVEIVIVIEQMIHGLGVVLGFGARVGSDGAIEEGHQFHGQREDDSRVLLDTDLSESLQVAQLDRHGLCGEQGGSFDELGGGVELALGMDDLGAAFTLGLSLLGHGTQHVLRHVDLFHFNGDDLYAEGRGVAVDDGLHTAVQGVAMGEEFIEIDFAENTAERGLRKLEGLVDVVAHLDYGQHRIDHPQRQDGVDLERNVVAGDDILRWDLHRFLPETHTHDLVERTEDEDDTGAGGVLADAAQTEDNGPLILFQNLDGVDQVKRNDDAGDQERCGEIHGDGSTCVSAS